MWEYERQVCVAWLVTINIDPHQESLSGVQSQHEKLEEASPIYWLEICLTTVQLHTALLNTHRPQRDKIQQKKRFPAFMPSLAALAHVRRLTTELTVERLQGLTCVCVCLCLRLCLELSALWPHPLAAGEEGVKTGKWVGKCIWSLSQRDMCHPLTAKVTTGQRHETAACRWNICRAADRRMALLHMIQVDS